MDIKPIETVYNGYRFRSRLEARWAVFFDAAGIPYDYEPEGFKLENGKRYLPDFYLPWFKAFVEVKRKNLSEQENDEAEEKCNLLYTDGPDCIVLLCKGDPVDMDMTIFCTAVHRLPFDGPRMEPWVDQARFLEGAVFDGGDWGYTKHIISIVVGVPGYADPIGFTTSKGEYWFEGEGSSHGGVAIDSLHYLDSYRSDLSEYRERGRKARFEHGETPKVKG